LVRIDPVHRVFRQAAGLAGGRAEEGGHCQLSGPRAPFPAPARLSGVA
jgi:hypothetical protein